MAEEDFNVNHNKTSEKDINDIFDSIAFSEELISDKAFQEGLIKGKKEGTFVGYHLGFHKGFEVGTEIGFYRGFTKVLINNLINLAPEKNEKIQCALEKLIHLLECFSVYNCQDEDIVKKIDNIRANFRKLNSLLKLNVTFPVNPLTSF